MTTKIKITHEGPDHKNVKVAISDGTRAEPAVVVLKTGQSHEAYVYDARRVEVTETDEPATKE